MRPVLILGAATAALSAGIGFLPVQGTRAHLGPLVTGAIVSLLAATAALVQPRAGRALDRGTFDVSVVTTSALLVMAGGAMAGAVWHGAVPLIAAGMLVGLGVGVATPVGFAMLAEAAPPGRMGQTMGAGEVGRELGDAGGPLLVGALSVMGLGVALAGLAAAIGVIAAATGGLARKKTAQWPP